jgi:hypothetical protein
METEYDYSFDMKERKITGYVKEYKQRPKISDTLAVIVITICFISLLLVLWYIIDKVTN